MAKKLSELNAATSVTNTDLIMIVTDVDNSALIETKKLQVQNLANGLFTVVSGNNITANVVGSTITVGVNDVVAFTAVNFKSPITPANSTVLAANTDVGAGTMFYDADFLYIATANNVIKRVALGDF
jgi:hypothetical protein